MSFSSLARAPPRGRSCGTVNAGQSVAERAGGEPVAACGVADVDPHRFLLGPCVAQRLEPSRRARAAPGGVDHEVGLERLLGAPVGAAQQADASDPPAIGRAAQARHVAWWREAHSGQGEDPGADAVLEQRAAHADERQARVGPGEAVPAEQQTSVGEHVADRDAVRDQVLGQAREQLLERLLSAREQGVDVPRLRCAAPVIRARREIVAVDDGHLAVGIGEHARGEQAGHAAAQHDGVVVVHAGSVWRTGARYPGRLLLTGAQ